MKKVKRSKIRIFRVMITLIVVLLFITFLISIFKHNNNNIDNKNINNENNNNKVNKLYDEFIIESVEGDSENIDKTLALGMNENELKELFNINIKTIKSNKKYEPKEYNFDRQLSYSEIENYFYNLSSSNIVNLENIGSSVDNRIIYGITLGKGNKALFIDGNVHAAEIGGTLFILKLLNDLVYDYESGNSEVIDFLNNYKIISVPCINPDGYEYVNFGIESIKNKSLWIYQNKDIIDVKNSKFNANGIDLNRNFPTQNGALVYKDKKIIDSVSLEKTNSIFKYYSGEHLGSEPETKAFMYYFIKNRDSIHTYVNLHSQGRVLYAGKPNLSDEFNSLCLSTAKRINNFTGYTVYGIDSEGVGEGNDGSVTDFVAEIAHGFKFSLKSGKLSSNKYIDNSVNLKHKYSVVTMETMDRYTTNVKYFKDEWIYRDFKKLFISLIKNDY